MSIRLFLGDWSESKGKILETEMDNERIKAKILHGIYVKLDTFGVHITFKREQLHALLPKLEKGDFDAPIRDLCESKHLKVSSDSMPHEDEFLLCINAYKEHLDESLKSVIENLETSLIEKLCELRRNIGESEPIYLSDIRKNFKEEKFGHIDIALKNLVSNEKIRHQKVGNKELPMGAPITGSNLDMNFSGTNGDAIHNVKSETDGFAHKYFVSDDAYNEHIGAQ